MTTQRNRTLYEILSPEGFRVHSTRNRQDAFRICQKFTDEDGVQHSVNACQSRIPRTF